MLKTNINLFLRRRSYTSYYHVCLSILSTKAMPGWLYLSELIITNWLALLTTTLTFSLRYSDLTRPTDKPLESKESLLVIINLNPVVFR